MNLQTLICIFAFLSTCRDSTGRLARAKRLLIDDSVVLAFHGPVKTYGWPFPFISGAHTGKLDDAGNVITITYFRRAAATCLEKIFSRAFMPAEE